MQACSSSPSIEERAEQSGAIASRVGPSGSQLAALVRPGQAQTLRIFIEGDGVAYITSTQPSGDPTPVDDMLIRLFMEEAGVAAYLARPCQYVSQPGCGIRSWTSGRFSKDNVHLMSSAVDQLKTMAGAKRVELVGYSGGAAMALLLASMRDDVSQVQTIAGTLDTTAWVKAQRLAPLDGSLNPIAFADRLAGVPQRHYIGSADTVMPKSVSESFLNQVRPACYEVIATRATHNSGFEQAWSEAKDRPISCAKIP